DVAHVSAELLDMFADQLKAAVGLFFGTFLDRSVRLDAHGARNRNRVADADRAGEADLFLEGRKRRDALAAVLRISHSAHSRRGLSFSSSSSSRLLARQLTGFARLLNRRRLA